MKIEDITIGQLQDLKALIGVRVDVPAPCVWNVGKIYLIRTVTMIDTGRLVAITPYELVLEDAAWIADTGRFAQAIENAEFGEVEPFPEGRVIVGRGSIVDAVEIKHAPRSQK